MSLEPAGLGDRAAELRRRFDASFAEAPGGGAGPHEDLLLVRIGGDAFAIRLSEVAALTMARRLASLPGRCPEFLGVVAFRGLIVPVFGLGALLGCPRGNGARWMVLAATDDCVGLAFDEYEGYLRIPEADVLTPDRSATMPDHVHAIARHGGAARPLLSLSSVLNAIKRRIRPGGPSMER